MNAVKRLAATSCCALASSLAFGAAVAPIAPVGAGTVASAARLDHAPPSGPIVRIGLTTDRRKVTIAADGPFRILDGDQPAWKPEYREEILVTTHGAAFNDARVWRVQVAAVATKDEADALAAKLASGLGEE